MTRRIKDRLVMIGFEITIFVLFAIGLSLSGLLRYTLIGLAGGLFALAWLISKELKKD